MSQIKISDLSFTHAGSYVPVFEHVSLQLDSNWKLGFTGRNGRGKTTFLKLLAGEYTYTGTISASVQFSYFPFTINEPYTFVIDLVEELAPAAEQWQIRKEFSLLDLDEHIFYRPFATLSPGEQTKVQLAALFLRENHFLLIDEPTNHLDQKGRQIVSNYLNSKKGFVLVSHDRVFLDGCIDHVLNINKTNIELQEGNFSSWYENKQRQDQYEQTQNERLRKEVGRLKETAQEKAAWSDKVERSKIGNHVYDRGYVGHKAEKMMKRSKALEQRQQKAIEEKSALLKNVERTDNLKLTTLPPPSHRLVTLRNVQILYNDQPANRPITFDVLAGERVALQGANGCGKSSILKLICGEPLSFTGTMERNRQLQISYISQTSEHLQGTLQDYAYQQQIDLSQFITILNKLDFSRTQIEQPMESYSMGQKKKVLLAASLCQQSHLYIWDEPLNYIDIYSRFQLEEVIQQFRPTMLFVEHDRQFTENIATKIIQLK
ncbi:MAG: ABC-F type ribosomal protection protein [Peptococcaceae bacterium]|nr:ABC-F type ribosomal protection protein [Peptococcaceae bacterium]MBQ2994466.1 ABC-F type ribosomal protection protein [Peptococcaceae bacterium]